MTSCRLATYDWAAQRDSSRHRRRARRSKDLCMTALDRPRVGLALGSGSARGWAHIGVIRALEKAGIRPDILCGTSIGALVGAAYAAGELDQLESWVLGLGVGDVVGLMDISLGGGVLEGRSFDRIFPARLGGPFDRGPREAIRRGRDFFTDRGGSLAAPRLDSSGRACLDRPARGIRPGEVGRIAAG